MSPALNEARTARMAAWLLLALSFASAAILRPLHLPDEGRYVGVAWEMLQAGRWLVPTLDGLPYFHKPPLFYWLSELAMAAFGPHEWAVRLVPLLAAGIGAAALWGLLHRWADRRLAHLTLAILLVQPLYFLGAQFANTDMLVAGCITVGITAAAHAALSLTSGQAWRPALMLAWLACALGVLAKGMIGLALPGLVMGSWLLWTGRWRIALRLLWLPGIGLFACVTVPWFMLLQHKYPGFLDYFFVDQQVRRFASQGFNNVQPLWFYPVLLCLSLLPYLPALVRQAAHRRALTEVPLAPDEHTPRDIGRLMICWLLVITLFFSIPQSKLIGYILPALPPLSALLALAARGQGPVPAQPRSRPNLWSVGIVLSGVISASAAVAAFVHPSNSFTALGRTLNRGHHAQEPVLMIEHFYFDARFYTGLQGPIQVFDHWDDTRLMAHDSWRKELADAGHFEPRLSSQVLRPFASLEQSLCTQLVSWVIGAPQAMQAFPVLRVVPAVARDEHRMLWRIDHADPLVASSLRCSGPP